MSIKVNAAGLDGGARLKVAEILDEYVKEMDDVIGSGENIAGLQTALTAKAQARILAVELRGGGDNEVAKLRAQVKQLMREIEVLTIELDRANTKAAK
jgi:hypothetical protein